MSQTRLVLNEATYQLVLKELVMEARRLLWIVTADIKDLYIEDGKRLSVKPVLEIGSIHVQLAHGREMQHVLQALG